MGGNHNQKQSPDKCKKPDRPKREIVFKLPDPLLVQQRPTAEDNEHYREEKTNRGKALTTARRANLISFLAAVSGLANLIFLGFSLRQSRESFERGQRAWLTVTRTPILDARPNASSVSAMDAPTIPLLAGVPVVVPIIFKNGGLSPALHVVMHTDHQVFQGVGCDVVPYDLPYKSDTTVGPGDPASNWNYSFTLPQACIDALDRNQATFKIQGVIAYMDVFQHDRHTHFCVQYQAMSNKHMTACPDGNDLD